MDSKLEVTLVSIREIAQATGGSLELLGATGNTVTVRYTPGLNEECPECMLAPPEMWQLLIESLRLHVPQYTEVVVVS